MSNEIISTRIDVLNHVSKASPIVGYLATKEESVVRGIISLSNIALGLLGGGILAWLQWGWLQSLIAAAIGILFLSTLSFLTKCAVWKAKAESFQARLRIETSKVSGLLAWDQTAFRVLQVLAETGASLTATDIQERLSDSSVEKVEKYLEILRERGLVQEHERRWCYGQLFALLNTLIR